MENGPFIDDFPIKTSIYKGFSMAMLNNQMVDCITPKAISPHLLKGRLALTALTLLGRHLPSRSNPRNGPRGGG